MFAPVKVCEYGHRYGLGNIVINIIKAILLLIVAAVVVILFAVSASHTAATPSYTASSSNLDADNGVATPPDQSTPDITVRTFYQAISRHDFQAAYDLLDPQFQENTSLAQFAAGYVTTQSVTSSTGDFDDVTGKLPTELDAVDIKNGETINTHYSGYWQLKHEDGGWKLFDGHFAHS